MGFRDLKKQYRVLKPQMDAAVEQVMTDCNFIGGNQVAELEQALAAYVGVRHCVSCANGTDALTLLMMAWGIGPGDAVFVPDFTFFSTGEIALFAGAAPVFVDVLPATYNMDPASLETAIKAVLKEGRLTPRVVIPVDLFGLPADFASIRPVAEKYGLRILEDGAQGFGGSLHGQKSCGLADAGTTSFFPAKPLGCYGDGGAVFLNDDETAALLRSIRVHGKGGMKYDNVRLGMNSRLDTIQAAILQVKFAAFQSCELEAVNRAAARYTERLAGNVVTPVVPEGVSSSWAQYTVQLKDRETRDRVQAELKAGGIPTMVYYPKPMHRQEAFGGKGCYVPCPQTERLCDTVLSLPIHPYLTEEDTETICYRLKASL